MNARQEKLFQDGYAATFMAADTLSEMHSQDIGLELPKVRKALTELRKASASMTTLESVLAGNPEPKGGE